VGVLVRVGVRAAEVPAPADAARLEDVPCDPAFVVPDPADAVDFDEDEDFDDFEEDDVADPDAPPEEADDPAPG
jgi:hypothetical protein